VSRIGSDRSNDFAAFFEPVPRVGFRVHGQCLASRLPEGAVDERLEDRFKVVLGTLLHASEQRTWIWGLVLAVFTIDRAGQLDPFPRVFAASGVKEPVGCKGDFLA
jgi:hypothetical protein